MQPLNNLDVCLLLLTALSAVIAFYRGLLKEVLSVIGWILAAVVVFYTLPVLSPFAERYIASSLMAGFVTAILVLIVFYVVWILSTDKLITRLRASKLSWADRWFGLFFGILRAFVIVVLLNILIGWMLPEDSKTGMFSQSRYYMFAGRYAEPLEALVPQSTIDMFKEQSAKIGLGSDEEKEDSKETSKKKSSEKEENKDNQPTAEEQKDLDKLFEDMVQPPVGKVAAKAVSAKENFDGYKNNEAANLDRLVENTAE